MALSDALEHIDSEIAKLDSQLKGLQQARSVLAGESETASAAAPVKGRRGRPKGSKNAASVAAPAVVAKAKRKLSPEGRKAIAEAMKKRWAEHRNTAK